MHNDLAEVLFTEEEIAGRVGEMGRAITRDYACTADEGGIVLVSVLRGAAIFMADLARRIELPVEMDYLAVSSYGNGAKSSGVVRILKDLTSETEGRHVIVAEDILDSGLTLTYLLKNLSSRHPASLDRQQIPRFRVPRRFHRGLRAGLRGTLSQPALHRHLEAGDLPITTYPRRTEAHRTGAVQPAR